MASTKTVETPSAEVTKESNLFRYRFDLTTRLHAASLNGGTFTLTELDRAMMADLLKSDTARWTAELNRKARKTAADEVSKRQSAIKSDLAGIADVPADLTNLVAIFDAFCVTLLSAPSDLGLQTLAKLGKNMNRAFFFVEEDMADRLPDIIEAATATIAEYAKAAADEAAAETEDTKDETK